MKKKQIIIKDKDIGGLIFLVTNDQEQSIYGFSSAIISGERIGSMYDIDSVGDIKGAYAIELWAWKNFDSLVDDKEYDMLDILNSVKEQFMEEQELCEEDWAELIAHYSIPYDERPNAGERWGKKLVR